MVLLMGRGRWYGIAVLGLLTAAGVLAWRLWPRTSPGPFDPVAAVIALAGLAVSIASLWLAARAQKQAGADAAAVVRKLAAVVKQEEAQARRQLLGGNDRAVDVKFSLQRAISHSASGTRQNGTLQEVVDYYRELQPRRMVITGEPGSGKTVLSVELILGLLGGWTEDAPVPVRMSAARLDTTLPSESAVETWVAQYLRENYGLQKGTARQIAAARMVLPVLDGLDEMDDIEHPGYSSRAAQVIRACNSYIDGGQKAAVVLTCRTGQYESLEQLHEWIHDAARVELRPVEFCAARTFLIRRVTDIARWQPLLNALRNNDGGPLARALSTPWRLTLAAAVYERRDPISGQYVDDPADLIELDDEAAIRDHLLGLFIPAIVAVHEERYSVFKVHRWLGAMAGYLNTGSPAASQRTRRFARRRPSGADLVLYELWPMAGARLPRIMSAVLPVLSFLVLIALIYGRRNALTQVCPPDGLYQICAPVIYTRSQEFPLITSLAQVQSARTDFYDVTAVTILVMTVTVFLVVYFSDFRFPVIGIQKLRTRAGRRKIRSSLLIGLVAGFIIGLMIGIIAGLVGGHWIGFAAGFVGGEAMGLIVGGLAALELGPDDYLVAGPRKTLRIVLMLGPGIGIAIMLVGALLIGFLVGQPFQAFIVLLLMSPLTMTIFGGTAAGRYLVLLICSRRWTRHWLPWRLGHFMHWCYGAGLMRVAGAAYQFRHQELQDYLVRNPVPVILE